MNSSTASGTRPDEGLVPRPCAYRALRVIGTLDSKRPYSGGRPAGPAVTPTL